MTAERNEKRECACIGGLGTGCLAVEDTGASNWNGVVKTARKKNPPADTDALSFAFTYRKEDGLNITLPLLCGGSACPDFAYTCALQTVVTADVSLTLRLFNPLIPLNSVDSGIPAVFAEIIAENRADRRIAVTVTALLNAFSAVAARPAYDGKTDAFYIALGDAGTRASRSAGTFVLGTTAADFTFEISENRDKNAFLQRIRETEGVLSGASGAGSAAMLSVHLSLEPQKKQSARFIAGWHFPHVSGGERSYYYHYFPDAASVVGYGFIHFDRLSGETDAFETLLKESALDPRLHALCRRAFSRVRHPAVRRTGMGVTYAPPGAKYGVSPSLELLFPGLVTDSAVCAARELLETGENESPRAFDTGLNAEETLRRLRLILALYLRLRRTGDMRFFSEHWVDLASMTHILCGGEAAGDESNRTETLLKKRTMQMGAAYAIRAAAGILRDGRRKKQFDELYRALRDDACDLAASRPDRFAVRLLSAESVLTFFLGVPTEEGSFFPRELLTSAAEAAAPDALRADLFAASTLEKLRFREKAAAMARAVLERGDDRYDVLSPLLCLYTAASGFEYDKKSMTLQAFPDDALCDESGEFRSFVCTGGAYGILSRGVDCIEFEIFVGELKVKRVFVSHKPYKLLYGGRLLPCAVAGNTVTADATLAVGKDRKLTVLIDITK